jgi:sialate O-acetylesterase
MPNVFGDHMVLQQHKPIQLWGWASPGEKITAELNGQKSETTANERGEWKITLPAMNAAGPFELSVQGSNSLHFHDVIIGEVWLCSGQSNMEMGIRITENGEAAVAAANEPGLRLLAVSNHWDSLPQSNFVGTWKICSPETVGADGWGGFSACAYYFGRKLHEELGVTVGVIDATWGGTSIQSWTPPEGFASVPSLVTEYHRVLLGDPRSIIHKARLNQFLGETETWLSNARDSLTNETPVSTMPAYPAELLPPHDLQNATALFNGMIHPLCPFTIAGAIWYQGENNHTEGMVYSDRMKALINGWRQIWGEGEFPFDFVQIAPYDYKESPEILGEFWEAQADAAKTIPNTRMAVINDIGNLSDIHPKDKKTVGERLARIALANTYNRHEVEFSGPTLRAQKVEGNQLRVTFDHSEGLKSRDGKPLTWFEIIDADHGSFVPADAKIDGDSVLLSSSAVPHPVAMRFAWSMLAEPNLVNAAGLPTGAFRAGAAPNRDWLEMNVPEATNYELVYDLDLKKLGKTIEYTTNRASQIKKPFDRIAYFLELQTGRAEPKYVFVSVDAFTDNLAKIGIPTSESGARFQQNLQHMNVFSNVKGVVSGQSLSGGNIEFWCSNYGMDNIANVPKASSQSYDWGDAPAEGEGYGSMQIHNHDASQTLFAINHWSEGEKADLGIGNSPSGNPDWTFAGNANSYTVKRLRVLVHCR